MKKRRIPLLILVLAILGFSYLLAPIVIVVLAGLNSGDFLSFPPKGLSLRWVIAFFLTIRKISQFLLFLFSIGFDDDGHLHDSWYHGSSLFVQTD